ncbi:hypothetical protein J7M23_01050 [Candidatus Sumerlaeota bacterium]|nr:hypothetical protein [Candidatus Sumerlaeota bacterium]
MKRITKHILCYVCLSLFISALAQARLTGEHFFITDKKGLSENVIKDILQTAELARQRVTDKVKRPFLLKTEIVLYLTQQEFQERTQHSSEHILASADPAQNVIFVNLQLLAQSPLEQFSKTFVHEYAHIYLGNMCSRRLPRWLDEGIAMHLAGDWHLSDAIDLAVARLSGKYIPLAELEVSFPSDPKRMRLAYLESYSLVSYILKQRYNRADVSVLVDDLTDPEDGQELISLYWNRLVRDGYELNWRNATKYAIRNFIIILMLAFNTIFWFGVSMLLIIAYFRKRRRQRPLLEEWENEERLYSSLDDYRSSHSHKEKDLY